jgi:hypothetical protein
MRFSSSNPVDEQHSTYLIDCDAFLSADVRFVRAVQDVRPFCPVPLARAVAVDANNPSIVERIDGALESAAD